jgi:two-component system, LytTR family, sensor kinase
MTFHSAQKTFRYGNPQFTNKNFTFEEQIPPPESDEMSTLKKQLRIYGPILLNIHLLIFFYSKLYKSFETVMICVVVSSCYALLTWESARLLTLHFQKKVPGIQNIRKRLTRILLWSLPITILGTVFNQLLKVWIGFFQRFTLLDFTFIEGLNIIISLLIVGIYEGLYYMEQWKIMYGEAEKFKKINQTSRYQFLEEQIKPHFLFNSLNTLASLITVKPNKAVQFTEEMSSVYRYLLKRNGSELTSLREEVAFLRSYILMLETRFEGSLKAEINISEEHSDMLIPPFVLQLLVENSVKHNIISQQKPLHIQVVSEKGNVVSVTNNLQKKSSTDFSEKKGLTNLIERYSLLKQDHNLYILEEEDQFIVKIPLLHSHVFIEVEL